MNPALSEIPGELAVLVSGGLDSAILLAAALARGSLVHPLYVRMGLAWEAVELAHLQRFLQALRASAPHVLDVPVADLYGEHWSRTGKNVPGADTPDEAVFLPGRNVLLLAKSLLWCHLQAIPALALGTLGSNPFPDATPEFFRRMQDVVNQAVGGSVRVICPLAGLTKNQVMQMGRSWPLELTFSCIAPVAGRHCGRCNKCAERQRAFREAGIVDRTGYEPPA